MSCVCENNDLLIFLGAILGALIAGLAGVITAYITDRFERGRRARERRYERLMNQYNAIHRYVGRVAALIDSLAKQFVTPRGFALNHVSDLWDLLSTGPSAKLNAFEIGGKELHKKVSDLEVNLRQALEGIERKEPQTFFATLYTVTSGLATEVLELLEGKMFNGTKSK